MKPTRSIILILGLFLILILSFTFSNQVYPGDPKDILNREDLQKRFLIEKIKKEDYNHLKDAIKGERYLRIQAIIQDLQAELIQLEGILIKAFPIALLHEIAIENPYPLSNILLAIEILEPPSQTIRRSDQINIFDLNFQVIQHHQFSNTLQIILHLKEEPFSLLEKVETEQKAEFQVTEIKIDQESSEGKININTASFEKLQKITGIGPVYAERIIEYRISHGPFQYIEEIKNISGIGEVRFERMKHEITVSNQ